MNDNKEMRREQYHLHLFKSTLHTILSRWGTQSRLPFFGYLWISGMLFLLVGLNIDHLGIYLVPPFAATLTIVLLLPDVGVAQPYPVVLGSSIGAVIGTLVSFIGRGLVFAVIAGLLALIILQLLHAYHPPGVALALYPILLHPGLWFPFLVVLPFALLTVSSASLFSRMLPGWPTYPRPRRDTHPLSKSEQE